MFVVCLLFILYLSCVYLGATETAVSALVSCSHSPFYKNIPSSAFKQAEHCTVCRQYICRNEKKTVIHQPSHFFFFPTLVALCSLCLLKQLFFHKCAAPGPRPELLYKAYLLLFVDAWKCLFKCPLLSKQDGTCSARAVSN